MITLNTFTPIIADKALFKPIDRVLHDGQCYILKGKNGIGKSTMLRILANIYHDYHGEYHNAYHIEQCQYITNNIRFSHDMRCDEILNLWNKIYDINGNIEDSNIFEKSLIKHHFGQLSNGQKQQLLLTKLLLIKRKIWLLDEMDSAIDQQTKQQFADMINNHTNIGGMVVMASHQDNHDIINKANIIYLESI